MSKNNVIVVFSSHLGESQNEQFKIDVHKSIGVIHDVYCYENFNQFSLSEIYNKAILEHNDPDSIFVFCHNDIIFKTKNWGKILLNHFNHSDYGILGIAGTTYLANTGRWWENKNNMFGIVEHTDGERIWVNSYSKPINGIQPVVTIDGLFMAVDCDKITNPFDIDFGKFHFYDLGFCFPNYIDGVDVGVITSIRILHKSVGVTNQEWEENRIKFVEKYSDELPLAVSPIVKDLNIKIKDQPKVSVIIPTKNNFDVLSNNIESWEEFVQYENYEIIIADTGSSEDVIKQYDELLQNNDKIKLVKYNYYNFGQINNDVARNHTSKDTEILLFCNDDIQLLNDALSRCVQVYMINKKSTGTIGIRLHYGNGTVQHCGILLMSDNEDRLHLSHTDLEKSSQYTTTVNYESAGNTGAFLMINKDLFFEIDAFNERYIECFEDVELNMKCLLKRKKNVTVCDAVAYHFESTSRGKNQDMLKKLNIDYKERLFPFYITHKKDLGKHVRSVSMSAPKPVSKEVVKY